MASTVPYTGVTSAAPEDRPIPTQQINTPLAAFGGETAQALEHLGGVSQQAGTELYTRAVAMQETFEQAKAAQAVAAFSDATGKRYTDLTSLQGRQAVEAYQPFLDGMRADQQQFRQGLDSPYAQRMFDQESRSMSGRLAIAAGGHVGEQNRQYLLGAAQSRVAAATNQIAAAPTSDSIAAANIDSIRSAAQDEATQHGMSPEATKQHIGDAVSSAVSARIQSLLRTQPFTAKKLLDDGVAKGDLNATDAAKLAGMIQSEQWIVGSRQIASVVGSGNNNQFGQGVVDIDRAAAAIRNIESGSPKGNYGITHPPTKTGDYALGAYGVMQSNLAPWLKDAGMAPMTEQEFLHNPAAQDQLFKFRFARDMQKYGSGNSAANVWFTGGPNPSPKNPGDGHTTPAQYIEKFNAGLAQGAPLGELVDVARAKADQMSPGDKILGDYAASHITTQFNETQRIQKDQEFEAKSTIEGMLVQGMQSGKLPSTLQEIQADPKGAQAWNQLSEPDHRRYLSVLAKNAAGDVAMTPERLGTFNRLYGEAVNDPAKFLNEDLLGADIPNSNKTELIKMRAQVYKRIDADPQTTRALRILKQANMTTDLATDTGNYAQFTGALSDELRQFQTDNKRSPKDEEVQTIGARLLQQGPSGMLGSYLTPGTPFYQTSVPDDAAKAIRNDPSWQRLGVTPDDNMVRRIYLQSQYQELYGAKPKGPGPASAPVQPRVPPSE